MTTNREYKKVIDELRECVAGRRGWVQLNLARLAKCEITLGSAKIVCRALGLEVHRHGKYGWTAGRPI